MTYSRHLYARSSNLRRLIFRTYQRFLSTAYSSVVSPNSHWSNRPKLIYGRPGQTTTARSQSAPRKHVDWGHLVTLSLCTSLALVILGGGIGTASLWLAFGAFGLLCFFLSEILLEITYQLYIQSEADDQ